MKTIYRKAFTLVELIVTITILAILWTITFLSFQWYVESTRNTVRISDVQNIKHALEFFTLKNQYYPVPSDYEEITFSGATLWRQWTFGNNPYVTLWVLSKIPVDPLTQNQYSYSVTASGDDYQIGYSFEWGEHINKTELSFLWEKAHAWTEDLLTAIEGDYDGKIIQTSTGGIDYVLAVPSLILNDFTHLDLLDIIENKTMSYEGFDALPQSYSWTRVRVSDKLFDVSDKDPIVFQWKFSDLETDKARLTFYEKLSRFYSDSQLRFKYEYEDFSSVYADMYNPTWNFSDIACRVSRELLRVKCVDYSRDWVLSSLIWTWAETNTWMLLAAWQPGSYLWQWNFGSVYFDQWLQNPTHERSSLWMPGNLSRAIGTKWKVFTGGKSPALYLWWYDITWDGNENILYGYWGKLYLGDTVWWWNIWESKVYDVKQIFWVESILQTWEKSIIVALGDDWILWVINWATWELERMSTSASWPVKKIKPSWPSVNFRTFDVDGDWIKEYHFKRWYSKYHAFRFFEQSGKVVWETLWSSEWYGNYNRWSDAYQPHQYSFGNIWWEIIVWTKWANNYAFYSASVDSSLDGTSKFKMPAYSKLLTWWGGWASGQAYFYDINNDGDDEYISLLTQETNNHKLSRVFVSWLTSTWSFTQYMSLSNPYNVVDGTVQSYGNFSWIFPLRNILDPEDSYILTYWRDPQDISVSKWMMLWYKWASETWYKVDSAANETFNTNIIYEKFDSSYWVSGIFNNGNKDYVVLNKGGEFYFYTFTWVDTFESTSTLTLAWSFYGEAILGWKWLDKRADENKGAGVFLTAADTDGNWLNEFIVAHNSSFKFYEITDAWVVLKKSYSYSWISGVIKWWITEDLQDIYAIWYSAATNTIEYYRSSLIGSNGVLTKRTDGNFFSWWNVRDILISKLWNLQDKYNRVMIEALGMYDARIASPANAPLKLWTDYYHSYDMDNDWENEIFKSWKAYTFNAVWNHTLKYQSEWWAWDFDWDWIKDRAWAYCKASTNYPRNVYFTIRSWVDGSYIAPDLDWWNGNGWCSWWWTHSVVGEDFNWDGTDELAAGVEARNTRILSFSGWTVTEWPQSSRSYYALSAFDVDGDWVKEVIQTIDKLSAFNVNTENNNTLESVVQMTPWVVATSRTAWGFPSIMRHEGIVYAAFRWLDWQVALQSWNWSSVTSHFKNYYLNTKVYSNSDSIIQNKLMPLPAADVLLGDFTWWWNIEVLVGWWDWYVYILSVLWNILKAYDVGASIKRIIVWDTNEDWFLDILVSAEDWYIHQIASSRLNPPSIIRDGQKLGSDDRFQSDSRQSGFHFPKVEWANGYFVQLYNSSKKSTVFDWVDIWDNNSVCIRSNDVSSSCISAGRKFQMIPWEIYQWRVQSYDDNISSPIALSNGFIIQ